MNRAQVGKCLELLGWSTYRDEVGDKFSVLALEDRIAVIGYTLRRHSSGQQLDATPSVTRADFAACCAEIDPQMGRYARLVTNFKGPQIIEPAILEAHVADVSSQALEWVQKQDIDAELARLAGLATTAPGTGPMLHLAALAVAGDVRRLTEYQAAFGRGDRLGFVPYVTEEHIGRALDLACRRAGA